MNKHKIVWAIYSVVTFINFYSVSFLRMEKNKSVFKVESGKYEFKSVN